MGLLSARVIVRPAWVRARNEGVHGYCNRIATGGKGPTARLRRDSGREASFHALCDRIVRRRSHRGGGGDQSGCTGRGLVGFL